MSSYRRRLLLANQSEENLVLYGNSVQDGTPTPEAPIDIMSVENPNIKIVGKNLYKLNIENMSGGYPHLGEATLVEKLENGVIVQGKVPTSGIGTTTWYCGWFQPFRNGSTSSVYLRKGDVVTVSADITWLDMANYKAGEKFGCYLCKQNTENNNTGVFLNKIPTSADVGITFRVYAKHTIKTTDGYYIPIFTLNSCKMKIENIQISFDSDENYEPYEEELITIDETTPFGRNLLKPLNTITENKKFTYDASSGDGTIIVSGMGDATLTSSTSVCYLNSNLDDLLIDGETYTMALNLEKQNPLSLLIQLKNKSTGKYSYISANKYTDRVINFKVDKSTYSYTQIYLQIAPQEQEQTIIAQPILALGKYTELPFEPYVPAITSMRGIGSYRDKIYTKDGKVYFEQMTAVFENDNSKDKFGTATSPQFYYYFQKPKNSIPSGISQTLQAKNPGLCNYFKYNPQLSENNTIFILSQNAIRAAFFTEDIEDVESWVANKTISVIYPIVKQEPIEITGYLADKILEIDKSKNITIYSNNGVYGNTKIVED